MRLFSSIRTFLALVFRRTRVNREMDEELRSHLQSRADDLEHQGLSRAEAERQARVEFGGYQRYKEECRDTLGTRLLGELNSDVRYGFRMLARKPGFAALVVLTLGLGVGANTAIFSIVDAVLLRPLPYTNAERLTVIWEAQIGHVGSSKLFDSYRDFQEWQRSSRSFQQLEALTWAFVGQTSNWQSKPLRVVAVPATQAMFSLLGVPAAHGRTFSPD